MTSVVTSSQVGDGDSPEEPVVIPEVSIASSSPTENPRFQPRASNGRFVKRDHADDLPADRYLDREISWLQFNERVLQLAADEGIPLLERARYLSIFTSNLDEFFMVRVAGLKRRIATGIALRSASGLEPREVLEHIAEVSHELMDLQAKVFHQQVRPALEGVGITLVDWSDLSPDEQSAMTQLFTEQIFPVLTPLAVDPAHPFPYISGL